MTRDGDIPTIFNPHSARNRTPSVVVTEEGVANGPFGHADSITSQPDSIGEALPLQIPPTGFAGKLKACSTSFCSKSAQKVSKHVPYMEFKYWFYSGK